MTTPPLRVRDLLEALAAYDPDSYVEVETPGTEDEDGSAEPTRTNLIGTRTRQDGRRRVVLEGE